MRTVLAIMLGVVLSLSAQASALGGSITGRAVNAAGGGVANQRVDLVRGGHVVNVATTDARGAWGFVNVAAGEYIVRTSVNGRLAGVRVVVAEGASVTATTIVVPTAAVAPQFGALAGLVASMSGSAAAAVASVATSVLTETEATDLNAEEIVAIFNALPAAEQVQFASAVVAATTNPNDANAFKPAPTAPNANTENRTNSTTNQAIFNVLTQVAQTPPAVVAELQNTNQKTTVNLTPSTGTNTGTVSATVPPTPSRPNPPAIVQTIPTAVS